MRHPHPPFGHVLPPAGEGSTRADVRGRDAMLAPPIRSTESYTRQSPRNCTRIMDTPVPTSADLNAQLARLRAAQQRQTPSYAQRVEDLKRLRSAFKARFEEFATAMSADFGRRSRHESLASDCVTVLKEIDHILRNLRGWMRPKKAAADWLFAPARTAVRYQPLGVVGIIAPWNYPLYLSLCPLAVAIAAGNHVMLKPSEHLPRTSQLLKDMLAEVFPEDRVATVLGGPEVAAAFASLAFDH